MEAAASELVEQTTAAAATGEESAENEGHESLRYVALGGIVAAAETFEDWTTPRSSYSQQVDSADDSSLACRALSTPASPALTSAVSPPQQWRCESWPLPDPERERLLDEFESTPSAVFGTSTHDGNEDAQQSPGHGIWRTEPASIEEPLLLLDEGEAEASAAATISRLRQELATARAGGKADSAALEACAADDEAAKRERAALLADCDRLEQQNSVLRMELESHHGIMAAEWGQTLGFQERLRQEEAACARLADENRHLRDDIVARAEEVAMLQHDASLWRVLCRIEGLQEVSSQELETVMEAALPGMNRIHAEIHSRSRAHALQLRQELEHRLCVVCRDAEKAVLFKPCRHLCVCEACRGRLRPYRCPICQEPVREHIGRVHF